MYCIFFSNILFLCSCPKLLVFCSQDCMKWSMLPILAESRAQMCRSLSGRFIGDPTYEYEYIDVKVVGEGEEAEEETNTVRLDLPFY